MISGHYFDGRTSASLAATLDFGGGMLRIEGASEPIAVPLSEVRISERIGNITRRFALPGGAVFETSDNDAVDQACVAAGVKLRSGLVYWLESRWPVAMGSLFAIVLVTVGFLRWGMPAVVSWAARVLPTELDAAIGSQSLNTLDTLIFTETTLGEKRQRQLQERFQAITSDLDDGHRYQLVLRNGDKSGIGANAFALPSGIIVLTDQLVDMAQDDEEIVAVLAHEVGHVRGRHALRHLLHAAGVSAMAMALLGDVSQIAGLLSSAPVLLIARQSREFELEADAFSRQWLRDHGIAESKFDAILCRLSKATGERHGYEFFSSHPPTDERAHCDR
jgi:Zn-dependent protease with chaperone function